MNIVLNLQLGRRALLFTFLLSLFTGLLFGLVPPFRLRARHPRDAQG